MGTVGDIPEPRHPVTAAGQHGLAVGAESHGADAELMLERGSDRGAIGGDPEPRVASSLPVSTILPSELNATAFTAS